GGGAPTGLAIWSGCLPAASDGWSLAVTSLRDLSSGDGVREAGSIRPEQAGGDFAGEAFRLGVATAEVHADLAAEFGTAENPPGGLRDLAEQMTRKLEWVCVKVPQLHPYADKVRGNSADLAGLRGPPPVPRHHGASPLSRRT